MTDVNDLEQFGIYEVDARNFQFAIYDGAGEMVGMRVKWGERYLFGEHFSGPSKSVDWIGERVGTVPDTYNDGTPIRTGLFELSQPDSVNAKRLLDWFMEWELKRGRVAIARERRLRNQ